MQNTEITKVENKTMTSLDVVTITGKLHKNIIRDIKSMGQEMSDLGGELKFEPSSYTTSQNKEVSMYNLNEDQYLLLATKYSNKMRMKLIKAWREAEDIIKDAIQTNEFLLEDNFIKNYNAGQNKIIMNFFRRVLENKGVDTFIQSIEYTLSKVNKDRKAKLLEDFRITYSKLIKEQDGEFGADNGAAIKGTKAVLEAKNREFARRSASHKATIYQKEIKSLEEDKKALKDIAPLHFSGLITLTKENDNTYTYEADDKNIEFSVTSFNGSNRTTGNAYSFMKGTIYIKEESLYIDVTGGIWDVTFRTKVDNNSHYQAILFVDNDRLTYNIILTKLK